MYKIGESLSCEKGPITLKSLRDILKNVPESLLNKPVLMYGDEEGNQIGKLYVIELDEKGVTLIPSDSIVPF